MRIGLGIDTHQLIPGKSIRLGGIDIQSNVSIKAHSDGDIIYHEIADSILGAIHRYSNSDTLGLILSQDLPPFSEKNTLFNRFIIQYLILLF